MARVKRGVTTHARHKKILELAKGYRGRGSTAYRIAIEKVEKGLQYAYRDRRNKKRDFRALWIQRINAGVREHGLTYSQFMHGIKLAGLDLDRKILSDIAIREPEAFAAIVTTARSALGYRTDRSGGLNPTPI
ncbi:MAG TPA: 50S ribosomal protein L20 [Stellaceae bacterium]|nr:50S ribosomal protein L20 [Stellaceae bacterium]